MRARRLFVLVAAVVAIVSVYILSQLTAWQRRLDVAVHQGFGIRVFADGGADDCGAARRINSN